MKLPLAISLIRVKGGGIGEYNKSDPIKKRIEKGTK
jgi:hypothetical protein